MKNVRSGLLCAIMLAAGAAGGCAEKARSCLDIDPRADEALRKMSDTLGGARSFSFRSVATMDAPIETGQLAQFSRDVHIIVRRPDAIFAQSHQGKDVMSLWYQGTNLTVLDKTPNTYATLQVPGQIDAMLDDVAAKQGLTLPLSDFLFSDPYKMLTANAQTGRYVGEHDLDGVKCHHLLFTQEAIDWQIWIDAAKQPVPRKLVIDYKSLTERPQFVAILSDWNLSAPVADGQFKAVVPTNAKKVELAQLLQPGQGE
jgi:hypothetical protein